MLELISSYILPAAYAQISKQSEMMVSLKAVIDNIELSDYQKSLTDLVDLTKTLIKQKDALLELLGKTQSIKDAAKLARVLADDGMKILEDIRLLPKVIDIVLNIRQVLVYQGLKLAQLIQCIEQT